MTRAIVWFRRDLSLDDNLAWATATRDHTEVLPVYVFDRRLLDSAGPYRRRQLIASVAALTDELRTLGGSLTVATGDPIEAVTRLAHEHRADTIVWNNDVTRLAQARDDAVHRRLSQSGISVERSWSTLIHPPGTILTAAGGVPRVFSRFYERWSSAPLPGPARAGHACILAIKGSSLPSIDGTSSAATPRASRSAWSASASGVTKRMPVSTPAGRSSLDRTRAIVVAAVGGATTIQRAPSPIGTSMRVSKPRVPTKKSTARSWSTTGTPTVRTSVTRMGVVM